MLDTCLYVDDWVCAFSDVSSALKVSLEAKDIMTDANMNLCKWSSNSDKLVQLWKNNDFHIHPIHSENTCESDKLHKVLGLPWHIQRDYITLDELWLRKISWDDELPADLHQTFIQWRSELFNLADLRVPRNILDCSLDGANDLQIHIFSDASQKAYGTAAYLRVKNGDHIEVNLIASKSRVAPLSPSSLTLPRLELMGALLAARLGREVLQVIQRKGTPSVIMTVQRQGGGGETSPTAHRLDGPETHWGGIVTGKKYRKRL
ncbi:hypothetical protein JTE90_002215 [Oedothorax gibbosus]|uniref:Reverse transcriptase domain-containing protein n=1 Tax=Oedothorax gibbosus TaxID=931172 RepID=A0AAV6TI49_9ARAC|nr:hypothetical protein JTE90_002215 [Oedothorax gibbosus]